ncbi:MAG: RnfABCDGE type electron transport complex subunit G [Lentisphaerae bacterium]|nr:RnfABCDGE type electron transport complex subunit G [Lentisphaerota bacterium]
MKDMLKLIAALTIISTVSGGLLAMVNSKTREPIRRAVETEKSAAIRNVLPVCDNDPNTDSIIVEHGGKQWTFYIGRNAGTFVGAAFEATSPEGYGGDVNIMAGVSDKGTVQAIEILPPKKETPGLGAKISGNEFRSQFADKNIRGTSWKVAKDGGDIQEITAATISSRAVVKALEAGLNAFVAHETIVRNTGAEAN